MNTTQQVIRMENISKVFYTDEVETHALSGVQLEVRKGEYVSIAGPSGSGKSTLLSIIGLLDTPTDGEYVLNGHQVATLYMNVLSRISYRDITSQYQRVKLS